MVVALLRLCSKRYHKAKLRRLEGINRMDEDTTYCHEDSSDDETVTEIVSSCLFSWQDQERYQEKDQTYQPSYIECLSNAIC